MFRIPALNQKDGYKVDHRRQYPSDTVKVYSNFTPRSTRMPNVDKVVVFGPQYWVHRMLIDEWQETFFNRPLDKVIASYKRRINNYLGPDAITFDHIEWLHKLGYLPLHVKAVPEGLKVKLRTPILTITNTRPEAFWLPNMVETNLSNHLWRTMTSATIADQYRKVFDKEAQLTGTDPLFVPWQGHDFSYRGLDPDSGAASGAAHLLSFTGTDTIPAIDFLEYYYGADSDKELIGGSVPATEHSVMCMGMKDGELETFRRLITKTYPKGIVSVVSDTWDYWKVLTEYLPALRNEVMAREGKLVIRPDSGDPVKIICGDPTSPIDHVRKGSIEVLWDLFGGTITSTGHRLLDSHIGLIYGDSITLERQQQILGGLREKGFASGNVVLGIGSYTYQYVTRDTFGLAMKATYGETLSGGPQEIYKDPVTDDGTKKSARGLLYVTEDGSLVDRVTAEEEASMGILQTIFKDGEQVNLTTLAEIRERLRR